MDKASEDEEGQLEEQIERLQEKVESAQSEQKNLFLVIFQVLSASGRSWKRLSVWDYTLRGPIWQPICFTSKKFIKPHKAFSGLCYFLEILKDND